MREKETRDDQMREDESTGMTDKQTRAFHALAQTMMKRYRENVERDRMPFPEQADIVGRAMSNFARAVCEHVSGSNERAMVFLADAANLMALSITRETK